MKIYISADIEGVTGVVRPEQTLLGGKDYSVARNLMVKEVNAAIEGAIEGGATEIVVCDAHSHQFNLLPELLHRKALLVSGNFKPVSSMLEGLDSSFTGVFLIGYHARAGVRSGVLNHTYYAKEIQNIKVNGIKVGELGINAALAGYYRVPICLVTGDEAVTEEAQALLNNVEAVAVKKSTGKYSAICLHPEVARNKIKTAAKKAVAEIQNKPVYNLSREINFEIGFSDTAMADMAELIPNVERIGDREIKIQSTDYLQVYKLFRACLYLAAAVHSIDY